MCGTSVWFLVRFLAILAVAYSQSYDLCKTPRNEQGECKPINICPSLYAYLLHRPIRPQDSDILRRSQCGFERTIPKVCCPLNDVASITQLVDGLSDSNILPNTTQCGIDNQNKIYGGESTDLSEFPWMTLIEYEDDNGGYGYFCGGVLIHKRYVLTAAHCIKGKWLPRSWKLVSVRLGEYNTDTAIDCVNNGFREECAPAPQNILVEEQIVHEQYIPYDVNQYHDIAVLRLAREAKFSVYVAPICLPKSTKVLRTDFTSRKLTVAGWGKTENSSESNVKLKLNVPVNDNDVCARTYRLAGINLIDGQMCAGGENGRDSCSGDSGGSLMSMEVDENGEINWYSIGVISFGPSPCGNGNWPGVYTKVSNYIDWIASKLRP